MAKSQKQKNNKNRETRPPVVVIMGHVDHGKTTILDSIRNQKVAEGESGGITQHIGAYQVEHQGKQITFIDTPGHEAFYAMRSRGAKVADIAVLVVAADDGVMPQTKEAIKHITHAGIPMIIAITKIDKQNADPAKVKNQLLEEQIVIEEFKGKVPSVEVSAKTGQGLDDLLDIINLVAEVEELTASSDIAAKGVVVEAELNHKRGPMGTVLIQEGTLHTNDVIAFSSTSGRLKMLEDFQGREITSAGPGTPVVVVGMEQVPRVGEKWKVVSTLEQARIFVQEEQKKYGEQKEVLDFPEGSRIINVVLKADVAGTLEALHELLRGIASDNVSLRVLSQSVGEVMESDVKLASTAHALIVGFRTKVNQSAAGFAQQMGVEVIISDVIYDVVEKVRARIAELMDEEKHEVEIGSLQVLAIFRTEKSRMIIGGKVSEGELKRGAKSQVFRGEELVGGGKIVQLKIQDKVVEKVEAGKECGILFDGSARIQVGDTLRAYEIQGRQI